MTSRILDGSMLAGVCLEKGREERAVQVVPCTTRYGWWWWWEWLHEETNSLPKSCCFISTLDKRRRIVANAHLAVHFTAMNGNGMLGANLLQDRTRRRRRRHFGSSLLSYIWEEMMAHRQTNEISWLPVEHDLKLSIDFVLQRRDWVAISLSSSPAIHLCMQP